MAVYCLTEAMQRRSDARDRHFTRYSGDIFQVWWTFSKSIMRNSFQDSMSQKSFKSVDS